MASIDYTGWIEIEPNSEVITQIEQENPILAAARTVPMNARSKPVDRSIKRSPQFVTGNGSRPAAYPEETGAGDKIMLTKEKIGDRIPLDEDEVRDMQADVLRAEVTEAGIGGQHVAIRAMTFADPAQKEALSTSAPFDSIWSVLRYGRAAHFGSTAEGPALNRIKYVGIGYQPTYDDFVDIQALVDQSKYARRGAARWIGDIAWKQILLKVKDNEGNPILGTAPGGLGMTLLGSPMSFCHGMEVAPVRWLSLPFYSGNATPAGTLGAVGDFYVDLNDNNAQTNTGTKSDKLYRKTGATTWTGIELTTGSGASGSRMITGGTDFGAAGTTQADNTYALITSANAANKTTPTNTILGQRLGASLNGVNAGQQSTSGQYGLMYTDPANLIIGGRERPAFRFTGSDASDSLDDLWLKYRERFAFGMGRQEPTAMFVKRFNA